MKKQAGLPAIALRRQLQAGQTLLEVLLAFSVLMLVLSAIILGVTTSLSNTQYTKNQGLANSYAQEGMTVVRGIRDSDWDTFSSYTEESTYCLGPDSADLTEPPPPCSLVGGIFVREVVFDHESENCKEGEPPTPTPTPTVFLMGSEVTVRVSWSDSKCPIGDPYCHKVELISCFSNIDQE